MAYRKKEEPSSYRAYIISDEPKYLSNAILFEANLTHFSQKDLNDQATLYFRLMTELHKKFKMFAI